MNYWKNFRPPGRFYNRGEKPGHVFEQHAGSNKYNRYFFLKVGRVVELDFDKYQFKVEWVTGSGSPSWMPISFPYIGPAGCIGTVPEIGALGIFGYMNEGTGTGTPICLTWIPVSLQSALDHNYIKLNPDSIPTDEENIVFLKFRKLQRGDVIVSSLLGGQLFVNSDIELKDSLQDKIQIRSSDQSIIMTSLNNYVFSEGVARYAGQVIRNKIPLFDADGNRIQNINAREASGLDGRNTKYLVPYGKPIDEHTQYYSEYRLDVSDLSDGVLDTNDINSMSHMVSRTPIVTFALGNYVGSLESSSRYGKILRPTLYANRLDKEGQFNLVECTQTNGMDQVDKLGLAFAIHLLNTDAFMGFDKEGHFYHYMGSSTSANPQGAGTSMSVLAQGSRKEIWGADANDGNSWDFSTRGGIKWDIGAHTGGFKNRSIDITTTSGVRLEISGSDADGIAKQEIICGDQNTSINGQDSLQVTGNSILDVWGLKKEDIGGSATYAYQSDKSENVLGVYTQVVIKEMQGKFGKRKETVLLGQELEIMTGDMVESIKTFGSKKTTLTLGNIEETIIAGNRKISIIAGKFTVDVKAGNIEITTLAGTAKLSGSLGVTVSSLAKAEVKALSVNLGMGPIRSGVVTGLPGGIPSHFDYVCGIPPRACMTVKAGM
jgi:hypothetical protein